MTILPPASSSDDSPPLWRRAIVSGPVIALVSIVVLGGALLWGVQAAGGVASVRARLGPAYVLVLIPAHAVIAISPFPSEVVAFGNGALFGFWTGALLSWFGWMMAALLHYGLVRRAVTNLELERYLARLPRWLRRFPVGHPVFLIAGRWIPYGPQLVSTVAGAERVPVFRFAWCQAIGILPVALFFSALATGLLGE